MEKKKKIIVLSQHSDQYALNAIQSVVENEGDVDFVPIHDGNTEYWQILDEVFESNINTASLLYVIGRGESSDGSFDFDEQVAIAQELGLPILYLHSGVMGEHEGVESVSYQSFSLFPFTKMMLDALGA